MLRFVYFLLVFVPFGTWAQTDTTQQLAVLGTADVIAGKQEQSVKVISAGRVAQNLEDVPVTMFVVTREEILRNGYTTLVDVLKAVPGIKVSQPGSGINGEMFLMRGLLGNYYTKILINNIPVQPEIAGGMPIGEQLPVRQAERIEIIFGPASTLYGADAMTGVINIITKVPDNTAFAQADLISGSYGYNHLSFMAGGKMGKNKNILHYSIFGTRGERADMNIQHYTKKGVYDARTYFGPDVTLNDIYDQFPLYQGSVDKPRLGQLRQYSRLVGLQLDYKGWSFGLLNMYRRDFSALGSMPVVYSYSDAGAMFGETITRTSLSYKGQKKRRLQYAFNFAATTYAMDPQSYQATNFEFYNSNRAYTYSAAGDFFIEQLLEFKLHEHLLLVGGLVIKGTSGLTRINDIPFAFDAQNYNFFGNTQFPSPDPQLEGFGYHQVTTASTGSFIQGLYQSKKLVVMGGVRSDFNSLYNTQRVFFRGAALYKFTPSLSARASYGNAYRAASPYYMYSSLAFPITEEPQPNIEYQLVPNTALKPEFMTAREYGIRFMPKDFLFEIAYFHNKVTNNISLQFVPLDPAQYPNNIAGNTEVRQYVNDDKAYSILKGWHTTLRWQNIIPSIKLNIDVYFSRTKGEEVLPKNHDKINDLRQMPRRFTQWSLSAQPHKKIYFNILYIKSGGWYTRYMPSRQYYDTKSFSYTSGYSTVDLVIGYKINNFFNGYLKVRNLFDTQYGGINAMGSDIDLLYNPQLGSNIQFGLNFKFSQ